MTRPVHYDLAEIEANARRVIADACAKVRADRAAKGKDRGLVDLQESMSEVTVANSVQIAKALNDGWSQSEIATVLGCVVGGIINAFRTNVDTPDGKYAPVFFDGVDEALDALISGQPGKHGVVVQTRTAPRVGGSA